MATLVKTHVVYLTDGRKVRVREYEDGSVRFAIQHADNKNYAISEAFLGVGNSGYAILKLIQT